MVYIVTLLGIDILLLSCYARAIAGKLAIETQMKLFIQSSVTLSLINATLSDGEQSLLWKLCIFI